MALPTQQQARFWGIAALVFIVALWAFGNVLLPFILGGAIAYFLDPVADRLEAWGLSRLMSTIVITVGAVFVFVLAFLLVVPLLIGQLGELISQIGEIFQNLPQIWSDIQDRLPALIPGLTIDDAFVKEQLTALGTAVQSSGGELVNTLLNSLRSVIDAMVFVVIVPVVTFYLLMDWDRMVANIDDLLPRDHAPTIRRLAAQIDRTLSSFIRGQVSVMMILGAYYGIALMIAGLNFGLIIGVFAGLISFIPYVGAFVGGAMAIGVALFQYWGGTEMVDGELVTYGTNWVRIGIIAAIFFAGQFLEGNILTPNLVGQSVGLHPVWLILSLSIFGSVFGFVGMLVAVPVAAVLGVLTRFLIEEYQKSRLYLGHSRKE